MREQTKQRMLRNIKEELAIDTMSKTDLEIIAEELEITPLEFVDIFEEVMEEVKLDTVKKLRELIWLIQPIHSLHKTTNNLHKDNINPNVTINHTEEILELLDGINFDLDSIRNPNDRIKSKVELIRYHLKNI